MKKINGTEYSECPHENAMLTNYRKLKQRRREEARLKRAILIQKAAGQALPVVLIVGGFVLVALVACQMFNNA